MTRTMIAAFAVAAAVVMALALVLRESAVEHDDERDGAPRAADTLAEPAAAIRPGFIHGRVIDGDGVAYEGRLRWGGDQEAFWNDFFDGVKDENPWAAHAPRARRREDDHRIEIFGFRFGDRDPASELGRGFVVRFGDIARIDARVGTVQVTIKSGTTFVLDRFAAGDIDDGVRVWDGRHGVVDLDARRIRTIEFLAATRPMAAPERLHGTVRTRQGDFTGFIQWNQQDGAATDELEGRSADSERSLRYDLIRSVARRSPDSALVTLVDGRELVLSGTSDVGRGSRGIYVDDIRYGRVLISWDAFERVDFTPVASGAGNSGPGYGDFPPGRLLGGSVTTRDGRRLAGRLVYDLDESETTDTLEASSQGVDYTIPFGLIASIVATGVEEGATTPRVILQNGEQLQFDRARDLRDGNAGILIFVNGRDRPEYLRWIDVQRIDFDQTSGRL